MAYYANLFNLRLSDFPNPGTPWVGATGIYLREGHVEGGGDPKLLIWRNPTGDSPPPAADLQAVHDKWSHFAEQMAEQVARLYGTHEWEAFWSAIVERYHRVSFRDLVHLPALEKWQEQAPGDFGGLGMDDDQSSIFYSIGIGDGSWGAFYDVCCLYPIRTAIFGFNSHLQLVHGRVDEQGYPYAAPFVGLDTTPDSRGLPFQAPAYLGLAALDECLLFMPIEEVGESLYSHLLKRKSGLLTDTSVCALNKLADGRISVSYQWHHSDSGKIQNQSEDFDVVIVTLPSWLIETNIQLGNFTPAMLPQPVINAWKTAHWETSCKVYAPLQKRFFDEDCAIPQILVTDTFVHDVYAYRYNAHYEQDCILLSYTWADDATKLASFSDQALADKCIKELDRILLRCNNVQQAISPYIDASNIRVQRWVTDRNALGCAKLYRAGTYFSYFPSCFQRKLLLVTRIVLTFFHLSNPVLLASFP